MSGFTNGQSYYYNQQEPQHGGPYYDGEEEYSNLQSQELNFQSFDVQDPLPQQYGGDQQFQQPQQSYNGAFPEMFTPSSQDFIGNSGPAEDFDEPPLLEELEIYPDRILEKTMAVLNPFRSQGLADNADFLAKDSDLAGPIAFCLVLAVCLFLSGNKAPFGYIYGLSLVSCIMMYCLLTLMTFSATPVFSFTNVASILGYCLIPIVGLSILGVFVSLHNIVGIVLAVMAVIWSSLSASRLFVAMSGDREQRPLIAYPCALVCGVFALLVVF